VVTPTKKKLWERAKEIQMGDILKSGLPAITPEPSEISEGGYLAKARTDLMSGPYMQQLKYLEEMGSEMGLKVIEKKHFREAMAGMKKIGLEWVNGWGKTERHKPKKAVVPKKIKVLTVPKPKKKRQRLHTGRVGKVPKVLRPRIRDGQKTFSYPDSIWKVRAPRRKKRKR